MILLTGSFITGLILSFLALGVFVSFRLFRFPDLTAEGSFALGGAVAAALIVAGANPILATVIAVFCGAAAGVATGTLFCKLKIGELLSGILVMTGLYSLNITIMGKSNLSLSSTPTLLTGLERAAGRFIDMSSHSMLWGWAVPTRSLYILCFLFLAVIACALMVYLFFRTDAGTAMRAVGSNPQMMKSLGVDTDLILIGGIAMANALIALSGAVMAQYQGFSDVQMGVGMLVWGIASLIIGDNLVGSKSLGLTIIGTIMGSLLFRLIISIALQWGLSPNLLKLLTALLVIAIIFFTGIFSKGRQKGESRA